MAETLTALSPIELWRGFFLRCCLNFAFDANSQIVNLKFLRQLLQAGQRTVGDGCDSNIIGPLSTGSVCMTWDGSDVVGKRACSYEPAGNQYDQPGGCSRSRAWRLLAFIMDTAVLYLPILL